MLDFDLQRCSRRCSVSDRELKDGETCYSVLVPQGGEVVRLDYSAEAWPGPPASAIGWWQSTVVDPNAGRPHWAPNDVMLNYFERLLDDPAADRPRRTDRARCRRPRATGDLLPAERTRIHRIGSDAQRRAGPGDPAAIGGAIADQW